MKALILTIALTFGFVNTVMACPSEYYACGQTNKLCCPY